MNANQAKQKKTLLIINFLLRAIQLFITIGLVGLISNRGKIVELSVAIYGQGLPLLNSQTFDFMMSKSAAIVISLCGFISVFVKDRFVEKIECELPINIVCAGCFFALSVAYVSCIGIGLSSS